jgi:hypothetical protein
MKEIILKVYSAIINLLALILCEKAKYVSKYILDNNISKKKIYFHFYTSIDMEFLMMLIINSLKKDHFIKINTIKKIYISNHSIYKKENINKSIGDLYKKVKINCEKYEIKSLYYPIIDDLHNEIKNYDLLKNIEIKISYFKEIKKLENKISEISKNFDTLILSDTCYALNSIFKQQFLKKKKRIFSIETKGTVNTFSEINIGEQSVSKKYFQNYCKNYKTYKFDIDNYLTERFSGNSNDINDLAFKFNNLGLRTINKDAKILFLNFFVDATNLNWSNKKIFASNLEWTEFTLKILKKNNYKNWFIKIHPIAFVYPGSKEILKKLKEKYLIPQNIIDDCPNLKTILRNKLPIYTHDGTAVLDSLCYNYKSYFCGTRFPSSFGYKADTVNKWKIFLNNSSHKNKVSKSLKSMAKYLLWRDNKFQNIKNLCPHRPIAPWDNKFKRFYIFLIQIKNIFFLKNSQNQIVRL